jgi:hypothetical protein
MGGLAVTVSGVWLLLVSLLASYLERTADHDGVTAVLLDGCALFK